MNPRNMQNLFAKGGTPYVWKSCDANEEKISKICPVKI